MSFNQLELRWGLAPVPLALRNVIQQRAFMLDNFGTANISIKKTECVTVLTQQRLCSCCFLWGQIRPILFIEARNCRWWRMLCCRGVTEHNEAALLLCLLVHLYSLWWRMYINRCSVPMSVVLPTGLLSRHLKQQHFYDAECVGEESLSWQGCLSLEGLCPGLECLV